MKKSVAATCQGRYFLNSLIDFLFDFLIWFFYWFSCVKMVPFLIEKKRMKSINFIEKNLESISSKTYWLQSIIDAQGWGVEKWQVTVVRSVFSNQEKKHHVRSTFGSWGVEKWHVTVARSVFSNQEIQSTPWSDHFWKLGRGKMAGHCGAKHIFKSTRSTFGSWGVEKWQVTVARSIFSNQEIQSTPCSDHFWKLGCGKMAGHCGAKHIFKSRNTNHTMRGALLEVGAWKNGRSLWREAYFQIKKYKAHHDRTTFGSWGVKKWQVTVVRSIFSNQEIQSTPWSDHFWKLGRGKMAGHCGAKRIFKSRNTKHTMVGALLEVGAWKNGRSLWCEAYFQIKKYKAHHARSTFGSWGVEKWQVTVERSIFSNQEIQSTPCSEHFWKLGCGKMADHCGEKHICKSRNTKHTMLGALLEVQMSKKCKWLCEAHLQVKMQKKQV